MRARYEWRGWNPDTWRARFAGFKAHPRVIDQRYLVNWNNKQARGFRASDTVMYSSTYRSVLLEDRAKRAIRGSRKLTLPKASTSWSWPGRPTCARTRCCRWR